MGRLNPRPSTLTMKLTGVCCGIMEEVSSSKPQILIFLLTASNSTIKSADRTLRTTGYCKLKRRYLRSCGEDDRVTSLSLPMVLVCFCDPVPMLIVVAPVPKEHERTLSKRPSLEVAQFSSLVEFEVRKYVVLARCRSSNCDGRAQNSGRLQPAFRYFAARPSATYPVLGAEFTLPLRPC